MSVKALSITTIKAALINSLEWTSNIPQRIHQQYLFLSHIGFSQWEVDNH
ncbi:hypothetical protein [Shewanella gaetbuli]|uniref:Uncharacterized protein n=1 Tax=Shewanella gaetbuli TaxID=220752 RepID=A0A9X1ZQL3_9GAMM|nr:hypothetical protein [Shewanella gaetbuli]MCL1143755.1 hypothetical protein [Shewanella gaetbuli]